MSRRPDTDPVPVGAVRIRLEVAPKTRDTIRVRAAREGVTMATWARRVVEAALLRKSDTAPPLPAPRKKSPGPG